MPLGCLQDNGIIPFQWDPQALDPEILQFGGFGISRKTVTEPTLTEDRGFVCSP